MITLRKTPSHSTIQGLFHFTVIVGLIIGPILIYWHHDILIKAEPNFELDGNDQNATFTKRQTTSFTTTNNSTDLPVSSAVKAQNYSIICFDKNEHVRFDYTPPHLRAERLKTLCSACYNETVKPPPTGGTCRSFAGYGSFLISKKLFFSIPNKCASTYFNALGVNLMNVEDWTFEQKKGLYNDTRALNVYSNRSALQAAQSRFTADDLKFLCQSPESQKILIVRHPILRIISAWNDKFNLNNTMMASGLDYGIKLLLHTKMGISTHFSKDKSFLLSEFMEKHCETTYKFTVGGTSCTPKKLRDWRDNPWHLISFKTFIEFLVKQDPATLEQHFSPISYKYQTLYTRNTCSFNYTSIIKIEHMKSELKEVLEADKTFDIPKEFQDLHHASPGGMNPTKSNDIVQKKVDDLFYNIDIPLREKLKEWYERDFVLFEYKWNIHTNKIFE